jgi:hypothetical protein
VESDAMAGSGDGTDLGHSNAEVSSRARRDRRLSRTHALLR